MSELEKVQARIKDIERSYEIRRESLEEVERDLKAMKLLLVKVQEEEKKLLTSAEF